MKVKKLRNNTCTVEIHAGLHYYEAMKKSAIIRFNHTAKGLCLGIIVLLLAALPVELTAQQQGSKQAVKKDEKTASAFQEFVEVLNVEVILRAMRKGELVSGLNASDFTLFENGQPVTITSFQEVKRKVGVHGGTLGGELQQDKANADAEPKRKRLFFFYFWVNEPELKIPGTLDFFFKNVYREGDYVLMMVRDRVHKITRPQQVAETLAAVKLDISNTARNIKLRKDRLVNYLEEMFRDFNEQFHDNERQSDDRAQEVLISRTVAKYIAAWNQYRHEYILFNNRVLKAIAASLKTVDMEKWGLVFYQHDTFPILNMESLYPQREDSYVHIYDLRREIRKYDGEMRRADRAPQFLRELQQEFIEANTTMHLLLSPGRTQGNMASIYMKHSYVHSDWQEAFRNISEATGGEIIDSGEFHKSLNQALEKEDIYYRLTYAPPKSSELQRKIRIKAKDKKLDLEYHQKIRLPNLGEIAIEHFSYQHPELAFTLKNYRQFFDGRKLYGDIGIKITGVDSKGEITSFFRDFEPAVQEMAVTMKINFPVGGKYSLILEAFDRQTGQSSVFSQKVEIPRQAGEPAVPVLVESMPGLADGATGGAQLDQLLDKAALYCDKLKKASFYFICNEEVTDSYYLKGEQVKEDRYYYDYQILMENEGMREKRDLRTTELQDDGQRKNKKRKRKHKKNTAPAPRFDTTNFYSKYPFLLPISMLAKKNQHKYQYSLLNQEKLQGRKTWKIAVESANDKKQKANCGLVWLDEEDGSVHKIQLHPHAMTGIEQLKLSARRKGAQLKVEDIHWFEITRKGIRFPSRTEITAGYFLPASAEIKIEDVSKSPSVPDFSEKLSTVFSYNSYRFFNVNIDVIHDSIQEGE